MQQVDVERSQEFRKCIECFLCQTVCHVIRDHEENKEAFSGPRMFIRAAELDMHPLDDRTDRAEQASHLQGIGYCNITKCCTEVCPEHIKITDNAIIPMKERVVDRRYDPLVWLGRKILRRDQMEQQAMADAGAPGSRCGSTPPNKDAPVHFAAPALPEGISFSQRIAAPQASPVGPDGKLPMTETLFDKAGPASPFGEDVTFPVEPEQLNYRHWKP
jgi:succinate dehydrogenase / fumarate reductase, iron-sulfur subunit